MKHLIRIRYGLLAAFLGLAGCHYGNAPQSGGQVSHQGDEKTAPLTSAQKADLKVAYGKMVEQRPGQEAQASAAYLEALQFDPNNVEAALRQAACLDRRGMFAESRELYQRALAAAPKQRQADVFFRMGYSLYLQQRWAESCVQFSQALALDRSHAKAHNNMGLALAHCGKLDHAFAEFLEAGCSRADAHTNLAYVLTLEQHFEAARRQYEEAQRADPNSTKAANGLRELTTLMAKAGNQG